MYVKLFSDILNSSIWAEDNETRLVWITLLALSDRDGMVRATAPGISHAARVPLPATVEAINKLTQPDEHSRTPDNDGRRIERVDGGFFVLNFAKYHAIRDEEERRDYMRKYMKKRRAVKNVNKM